MGDKLEEKLGNKLGDKFENVGEKSEKGIFLFGKTQLGLPILGYSFSSISSAGLSTSSISSATSSVGSSKKILVLGGVHGDEIEGVFAARTLLRNAMENHYLDLALPLDLVIVPEFNPEGVLLHQRTNSRGVDLNRNLPTKDWQSLTLNPRYPPGPSANSEPESQSLVRWLDDNSVRFILSLHSWKPLLNVNGDCLEVAKIIASRTGYSIEESIGYPTPGCLGTYAGLERKIPTLTYEIERGIDLSKIEKIHIPAIWEALQSLKHNV